MHRFERAGKKCGNITILYTYRRRRRLHTLIFYTWDRMIFSPVLPTHPSHFHYFNTHTFQMLIFIWNCVCYSKVTRICYYSSISIGYRISKYDLFLGFATHCTFCVLENIAEEFFVVIPFHSPYSLASFHSSVVLMTMNCRFTSCIPFSILFTFNTYDTKKMEKKKNRASSDGWHVSTWKFQETLRIQ